ncbi:MAG: Crp/Fnr family transcriptional regulator [Pyrinomonadaceae bacterium]
MPSTSQKSSIKNRLLAALPRNEFERLNPHLEPVSLPKGHLIYDAGDIVRHAYFLQTGMVSLLSATTKSQVIEVGMVGDEGLVGIPGVLRNRRAPLRAIVQIPASALKISADALRREFKRGGELQELILCFTHSLVTQMGQGVACNRYHTNEQRLARWLLMTRDRTHTPTFDLTHSFLSYMLGVARSGVTAAAGVLHDEGLISYRRGKIKILDEAGLESAACDCYRVIREDCASSLAA